MDNNKQEIGIIDLFKHLFSKRKKIIKWGFIGLFIGCVISFSMPKEYKVEATIVTENIAKSQPSLGGLAALAGIDQASTDGVSDKLYPDIIQLPAFVLNLSSIKVPYQEDSISFMDYLTMHKKKPWWNYVAGSPIKFIGWFSSLFSNAPQKQYDDTIVDLKNPTPKQRAFIGEFNGIVEAEIDKKSGLLKVSIETQSPDISVQIADSIIVNLQKYMTLYRTDKTRADIESSIKIFNDAKLTYYQLDSAYAALADRNVQLTKQSAMIKLQRVKNERDLSYTIFQQLATKMESLYIKLQEETPIMTVIDAPMLPHRPTSPAKLKIIILATFIFGFASTAITAAKFIFSNKLYK